MGLSLTNLDNQTRPLMVDEIQADIKSGKLYLSQRLNSQGQKDYPNLLLTAAQYRDDMWLADELRKGRLNATEQARKPSGGYITKKVPINAAETLAEGEFNRFYIRGLCKRAIGNGIADLVIYRAKQVTNPRSDSAAKIGTTINAQTLLSDLRINIGIDTALGLPPGPNSGLSVRLP